MNGIVQELFALNGKQAIVTGGATGIGRSCALALAKAGAKVIIADVNEAEGEETALELRTVGEVGRFIRCDVGDPASVETMMEGSRAIFTGLDIGINCAGIYQHALDEEQDPLGWDRVVRVNLTGAWLCARAQMLQMRKSAPPHGKIINIGSIAATIACSNGSYDAAKAGVAGLTRTLAARWGRYNINVNCVSPGYVGKAFGVQRSEDERVRIRKATPLGHVQRQKDLHGAILFFASSASDYITGQNLVVDGGHTLSSWLSPLERTAPPRVSPIAELDDE